MTGSRGRTGLTFEDSPTHRVARVDGSRGEFGGPVAAFGAAAALTQLLIACGQAAASPSPGPATAAPTTAAVVTSAPTAAPTPVPTPEKELFVYNWDGYIADDTVAKFQDKYGIKVTYDNFPDEA